MTTVPKTYPGRGSFKRGLHPAEQKILAADAPIEIVPAPAQVLVPLLQHIGAPCEPVVKAREQVTAGQVIGQASGFISANVHASIAGKTGMLTVATLPNGRHVKAVPIKADEDQPSTAEVWADNFGGDWPTDGIDQYSPQQITEAISAAGIVGMGGAAFPTHVKLIRNDAKPVDTLVVNACECEPYLTADDRLMRQAAGSIICGVLLAGRACGAEKIYIVLEDNKPIAASSLARASRRTGIQLAIVKTQYPMGGERQLIPAVMGREVPAGGLPLDVGVVVINVATASAIARAVVRGKPVTHRVMTVSGAGIVKPRNLMVPIGISFGELIDYCGGLTEDAARVIAGGPMMGFALAPDNFKAPVTKGTSGLTVLTGQDVRKADETHCIRCGRCVDVCPLNLVPTKIALAARGKDWPLAKRYYISTCCECGCCAYVCPAGLPLAQLIRMGKAQMPRD